LRFRGRVQISATIPPVDQRIGTACSNRVSALRSRPRPVDWG